MSFLSRPHRAWYRRSRGRRIAFGSLFRYPNRLRPELLRELLEPSLNSPGFGAAIRAASGYDTRHRLAEL